MVRQSASGRQFVSPWIGKRLQRWRMRRSLEVPDAARAAKVSKAYLYRLESGEAKNPGLFVLERLAIAYDVPLGNLLTEDP